MPRINREFRTLIGPENTFALGSSMGSLLSYYLVKNHPDAFGACGCVSTHFAFSETNIRKDIAGGDTVPAGARLFFDYGTETLDSSYEEDHEPVRQWLLEQGLVEGRDFRFQKYEGADHGERAWRARVGDQLEWLLGE
jgi:predicted alpha/beta superfamily hydrolase